MTKGFPFLKAGCGGSGASDLAPPSAASLSWSSSLLSLYIL